MKTKPRVLFLCTGNSCRSQMAEGWARHLAAGAIEAYSAGVEAHGMNPGAVRVMSEVGVDITPQSSKTVDALDAVEFDCVVTVCPDAHDRRPRFSPHTRVLHVPFEDPARAEGDENERLEVFRRVRDEIRAFVDSFVPSLRSSG